MDDAGLKADIVIIALRRARWTALEKGLGLKPTDGDSDTRSIAIAASCNLSIKAHGAAI